MKPTPEFIWEMRDLVSKIQDKWSEFPSTAEQCNSEQYAHYNNVSRIIDILRSNIEFANETLTKE